LDEINIALKLNYLNVPRCASRTSKKKSAQSHVLLVGALPELIAQAGWLRK
jgi:ATP:corrinoid adenosyltransferase